MADLKAFAEQLVNLTVKEVNELAQILKEECLHTLWYFKIAYFIIQLILIIL